MPANSSSYEKIQSKIHALKGSYPSLRTKSDDYVFSALCVKSHLFKNPALVLYENDFDEMIVDGQYDGGVDVLLTDPNSEESDMVIAQSKFYTSISADDVMNAMTKMASFFKDMSQGHYEQVNSTDNFLLYGDNAAIVNVSAFSIKALYAQHNIQLLAKNLRYHISGRDIDRGIEETIRYAPESFWLKNNGITIVCGDFEIDGREVKLHDFSIINGGQTTYMLHKSRYIDEDRDLFLPCKIIRTDGDTEDEKNTFSLAIAKATNTQKPIKPVDLKANSPEQIRFSQAMRDVGIFYQTKRGETVPRAYKEAFLNSSLVEVGKLGLAAIFQIPCVSRSKPSSLYLPQYYEKIFNGNQQQIAKLCRELLYIDYYFRNIYQKKFDRDNASVPSANDRISFAHNARTICIAFAAFASRYHQGNIQNQHLDTIFAAARSDNATDSRLYDIFTNLENVSYFIPAAVFNQKDKYDAILDQLFTTIINAGITSFSMASRYDSTLTATNFLKKDKNYYAILDDHWASLRGDIKRIFEGIM